MIEDQYNQDLFFHLMNHKECQIPEKIHVQSTGKRLKSFVLIAKKESVQIVLYSVIISLMIFVWSKMSLMRSIWELSVSWKCFKLWPKQHKKNQTKLKWISFSKISKINQIDLSRTWRISSEKWEPSWRCKNRPLRQFWIKICNTSNMNW